MGKFVLKRLAWLVVLLVATAIIIFTILYLTPRNPAAYLLGGSAPEADVIAMTEKLGLTRPYLVQLGEYLYNVFIKLEFGNSWVYGKPVYDELIKRLPTTMIIGLCSIAIDVVIGLMLGIMASVNVGKWQDSVTMAFAIFFISAPDFWVALMMIIVFSAKLGWLPAFGVDTWKGYIMPILATAFAGIANNARQTRSSMLEVFRADYITTARAKGQTEKKIIMSHMLPNALMPVITAMGGRLSRIVAGAAIIESVFTIPGVGLYMLTSVNFFDYPAIRACVLFFAAFASVVMLLTDIAYGFIDPRIKAQYVSRK